jgi:hypothetical protein
MARRPVGLSCVKDQLRLKTHHSHDEPRNLGDGDFPLRADVDVLFTAVSLRQEYDRIGTVVHVHELSLERPCLEEGRLLASGTVDAHLLTQAGQAIAPEK